MIITTPKMLIESLEAYTPEMVVDIETDGFDLWNFNQLCGIGVCTSNEETFYYPFRHKMPERFTMLGALFGDDMGNLPLDTMSGIFSALTHAEVIIGHNIKFDLVGLKKEGYQVPEHQVIEDTVSAARMYFKKKYDRLNLGNLVRSLFPEDSATGWKGDFGEYFKGLKLNSYDEAAPAVLGAYCESDCLWTWRARNKLIEHIDLTEQRRVWEQEKLVTKTFWEMEQEGLYFDREYCLTRIPFLRKKLEDLSAIIYADVGMEFDINSSDQITEALGTLGIEAKFKSEKTGKPKWDTAELLSCGHEVGPKILEWRGIDKMRNTYFEPLLKWKDDRQHPSFKSAGTITGRVSCENPNLQNLSNKSIVLEGDKYDEEAVDAIKALMGAKGGGNRMDETKGHIKTAGTFSNLIASTSMFEDNLGSIAVKRLYVAPKGFKMWFWDFNQMEMRGFSDYVRDESMFELLEDPDFDFHAFCAKQVWKVDETNPLWKFYRVLAKAINFGLIYGIGVDKLARQIQRTKEEAEEYKNQYFAKFPKAKNFMRKVQNTVKTRGWIKNRFGRRYWIDEEKAYVGVNYLIQGSCADIVKNRMVASQALLKKFGCKSKLVVQIHDELVFYIHDDEELWLPKMIHDCIEERQIQTFLPIDASKGYPSWANKKKMCIHCIEIKGDDHACDLDRLNLIEKERAKVWQKMGLNPEDSVRSSPEKIA